jgi:hypothetical protein
VLARIREIRQGRLNDPRFGWRMRGSGPVADLVSNVFRVSRERAGIPRSSSGLSTTAFRVPRAQRSLFE